MADNLPEPESRKEQYLAKAAGMTVEDLPTPASREEQYLNAIAEGGGGGGTSDFDQLSNRPKYNGTAMTGETNIPASPTVVQDIGTSTTDVMSQDATTQMIYKVPSSRNQIVIGNQAYSGAGGNQRQIVIGGNATTSMSEGSIAIGGYASSTNQDSIAIGGHASNTHSSASGSFSIALGGYCTASGNHSVAIGSGSNATIKGQFDISAGTSGTNGYNSTYYRLLTGLYDPQNAHDAATKGYVDGLVGDVESALNAINNGGN